MEMSEESLDFAKHTHDKTLELLFDTAERFGAEAAGALVSGIIGAICEFMWATRGDRESTAEDAMDMMREMSGGFFTQMEEQDQEREKEGVTQ